MMFTLVRVAGVALLTIIDLDLLYFVLPFPLVCAGVRLWLRARPYRAYELSIVTSAAIHTSFSMVLLAFEASGYFEAKQFAFPPWAHFVWIVILWSKIVEHSLSLPISTPSHLLVRIYYVLLSVLVECRLLNQHIDEPVIIFGGLGGAVLVSCLLEHQQRTHKLTVLRITQQADQFSRSTSASRTERGTLARAFERERLPALLLQGRIAIDDLRLGAILGRGSFGTVHAASWRVKRRCEELGSSAAAQEDMRAGCPDPYGAEPSLPVAAKVIHRTGLTEHVLPSLIRGLELEMSLCKHPNIAATLGVAWSVETARVLTVLELCSGGSLDGALYLGVSRAWHASRKLAVALGVAEAMSFLHGLRPSVMHRDIKPENILFAAADYAGEPKLSDFGESRYIDEETINGMTAGIGTPYFSAPELLTRSRYDLSVDVWAFGCVLVCLYSDSNFPYPLAERQRNEGIGQSVLGRVMCSGLAPSLPASDSMHGFVRDCCQHAPAARPSAVTLCTHLRAARDRLFTPLENPKSGGEDSVRIRK